MTVNGDKTGTEVGLALLVSFMSTSGKPVRDHVLVAADFQLVV